MPTYLKRSCAICGKKQGIKLCGACRVIYYCSSNHQADHRPIHKAACNAVKEANLAVQDEDSLLSAMQEIEGVPLSFSNYSYAKDMHDARVSLFRALTDIDTMASLKAQFDNLLRLFFLGPGYTPFARFYVQSLMIRLRMDQECYDFTEWFKVAINTPDCDWASKAMKGVTVKGANAFELEDTLEERSSNLDLKIHQIMIKVRICADLNELTRPLSAAGPSAQSYVPKSPILASRPDLLKEEKTTLSEMRETMSKQILVLIKLVNDANKYYWEALISPSDLNRANQRLQMESCIDESWKSNSREIAESLVKITIDAWRSIPGSLDIVRDIWDRVSIRISEEPMAGPSGA